VSFALLLGPGLAEMARNQPRNLEEDRIALVEAVVRKCGWGEASAAALSGPRMRRAGIAAQVLALIRSAVGGLKSALRGHSAASRKARGVPPNPVLPTPS
jgi:hypothetical protein